MKPQWPKIDTSMFGKSIDEFKANAGFALQKFSAQALDMLNGKLTIRDNMLASMQDVALIHETSVTIKNPLGCRPTGVRAVRSVKNYASGLPVQSIEWDYSSATNKIELFASFAPPQGFLSLRKTTNQSISNSTGTAIEWETEDSESRVLTHSTTSNTARISADAKGVVQLSMHVVFAANATGYRAIAFGKNTRSGAAGELFGENIVPAATGIETCPVSTVMIPVNAGDYIQAFCSHNSGGSLNVQGNTAPSYQSRLQARYVAPPAAYTSDVTLIIEGG